MREQNLMYADLSLGYWAYRGDARDRLSGVSLLNELHYTTTLQRTDTITDFGVVEPANGGNYMDVLNYTGGIRLECFRNSTLTVGASVPVRNGDERLYDVEVIAQFNRPY